MKLVRLCMGNGTQLTNFLLCAARSLSTVVSGLEFLCKQKGLDSYANPSGTAYYITSEMFYIEIHLENDGTAKDVKVAHPGKYPLTCEDLLQLLRMKNYDAFGNVLEDLVKLYQIPGDSSTKIKVHVALHTLEKDLCSLSALHRTPDMDRVTEILFGKVGYITPRTGGIPLSLEFYLSPYQILEEQLNPGLQISGMKVFLTMGQADEKHTFPLSPLIVDSVSGEDGNPNFLPLTEVVCVDLLACFFLTFQQPFPMSLSRIQELQKLTGLVIAGLKPAPLRELIVQLALSEKCMDDPTMRNSFIVSLPDCPKHSYFIDTSADEKPGLTGAMISNVPFAHFKCVPDMIEILRHQAAYNTLFSSCISAHTKCEDSSDLLYFEVSPLNGSSFSVTFQHPLEENLACVVVDVLSSREVRCTLRTISEDADLNCSNDFLARVLKRCMSIPVLMRTIFKRATKQETAKAVQSMEGNCKQNPNENKESKAANSSTGSPSAGDDPNENKESKAANSSIGLPSAGDDCATLSDSLEELLQILYSPEESLPETSGQVSWYNSMEETAFLETAFLEPSGGGLEEIAFLEPSGGSLPETAFLEPSGGGLGEIAFLESSGGGLGEIVFLEPSGGGLGEIAFLEPSGGGLKEIASLEPSGGGLEETGSLEPSGGGLEETASLEPSGDASLEPSEGGLEETASLEPSGGGLEETASLEPSGDASLEPSGGGLEETASPEPSGDASLEPSGDGSEETASPEPSGDGIKEKISSASLQLTDEETLLASSPENKVEDCCTNSLQVSAESME